MKHQGKRIRGRRALSVTAETSLVILGALLVFALIVGFASQHLFRQVLNTNAGDVNDTIAKIAADCVDGDKLTSCVYSLWTDEESQVTLHSLQELCDDAGFNHLSIVTPYFEDDTIGYIVSVRGSDKTDLEVHEVGDITKIESDSVREAYEAIMNGESSVAHALVLDGDDGYVCSMVPITNEDGEILAVMRAESSYTEYESIFQGFCIFLGIVALVIVMLNGFITSRLMRARLTKPIERIAGEATRFAQSRTVSEGGLGKLVARGNELGLLASSLDAMEHEIVESIEDIKVMTTEKEHLNAELDIAARIQESALPHVFPAFPDRSEFDLYALMDPAKEIGGDFYDYFLIDDDHLALVIADVSGKGVPAALFMMESKVTIKSLSAMMTDPARVISAVNDKLSADNEMLMFVTVWLGILEISTGALTCCNAGHEYPAIRHGDGGFQLLHDSHGLALGAMEGMPYSSYTVQLCAGDMVLVYTDGAPEARNGAGELYGTDRLVGALNSCPEGTVDSLVEHLTGDISAFTGDAEQFDDLTVLALRYQGPASE